MTTSLPHSTSLLQRSRVSSATYRWFFDVSSEADAITSHVDLDAIHDIACQAGALPLLNEAVEAPEARPARARIGVLQDEAFSFYYPENLEALEDAGAELVPISPIRDTTLPSIDGLYAGGGFKSHRIDIFF